MAKAAAKRSARNERVAAVLTINGPGRMTKRGRRDLAAWLRKHATEILQNGDAYTKGRFRGRLLYLE